MKEFVYDDIAGARAGCITGLLKVKPLTTKLTYNLTMANNPNLTCIAGSLLACIEAVKSIHPCNHPIIP
jgi:hypothetical protein